MGLNLGILLVAGTVHFLPGMDLSILPLGAVFWFSLLIGE